MKTKKIIFLLTLIFVLAGCDYSKNQNNQSQKNPVTTEKEQIKKTLIPVNWEKYRNEVLGIEFAYPKEWGDPITEPKENITRLKDVIAPYNTSDNAYFEKIILNFKNFNGGYAYRTRPMISFFSEKYLGEEYPFVNAYENGWFIDNFLTLKKSGDICDYKINFSQTINNQSKPNLIDEIESQCNNKIKTAFIRETDYFENFMDKGNFFKYSYRNRAFAYKKISNGYFDNVLLEYNWKSTGQTDFPNMAFDQYLREIEITKEDYQKQLSDFELFVSSFIFFKPIEKPKEAFQEDLKLDKEINIIRKYYYLLENEKVDEAFAMIKDGENFEEKFRKNYHNIFKVKPFDFKKIAQSKYDFLIDYQDHNEPKEKYRMIMQINKDNKISILSADKYLVDNVFFENMKAYAINRNHKNLVILEKDQEEIVLDQAGDCSEIYPDGTECPYEIGDMLFYTKINFSPNGNYLVYSGNGWEWTITKIYDIKNQKTIDIGGNKDIGDNNFYFTPDERFVFHCNQFGMGVGSEIFQIPNFNKTFDIFSTSKAKEYLDYNPEIECGYNEEKKEIWFQFIAHKEDTVDGRDINEFIRFSTETERIIE